MTAHRATTLSVEQARSGDAQELVRIHFAAVHQTAGAFYTEAITSCWAPPINEERVAQMRRVLEESDEIVVVARWEGEVVGFGSLVPAGNELRAVYVHPQWGRHGIGTGILQNLERIALERGMAYLQMDASLNAEAFYRRNGFTVVEYGIHSFSSGQRMECVKMKKVLDCTYPPPTLGGG